MMTAASVLLCAVLTGLIWATGTLLFDGMTRAETSKYEANLLTQMQRDVEAGLGAIDRKLWTLHAGSELKELFYYAGDSGEAVDKLIEQLAEEMRAVFSEEDGVESAILAGRNDILEEVSLPSGTYTQSDGYVYHHLASDRDLSSYFGVEGTRYYLEKYAPNVSDPVVEKLRAERSGAS